MLLEGKVVLVSGIGPGLGIELATLAAKEGARGVAIAARTASKLDDAETAIARSASRRRSSSSRPTSATARNASAWSRLPSALSAGSTRW